MQNSSAVITGSCCLEILIFRVTLFRQKGVLASQQESPSSRESQVHMPTEDAVLDVIEDWSGSRPANLSQNLEDWWNQTAPGSPHSAILFKDGVLDLITRLQTAFPDSPRLQQGDFVGGGIKTVQDLVNALQPTMQIGMQTAMAVRRVGIAAARTTVPKKAAKKPTAKRPTEKRPAAKKRSAKKGLAKKKKRNKK